MNTSEPIYHVEAWDPAHTTGVRGKECLAEDGADPLSVKGDSCLGRGELEAAEQYYLRVLQARPDHSGGLVGLAQVALNRGDIDRARQLTHHLRRTAANPEMAAAMQWSIRLLKECLKLGGPVQIADRAASDPEDARTLYALAVCLAARGRLLNSLEHLSLILEDQSLLHRVDVSETMRHVLFIAEQRGVPVDPYWTRLPHATGPTWP